MVLRDDLKMNPKPWNTGHLEEKDGHQVYYAQYGNPSGIPIIVCHGGPGGKSKPKHVNRYNMDEYRVITFDQRGCGQSLPLGKIEFNTTQDLVDDMERLRNRLNIQTWYVAGGSWGSTVALAYAESFPEKIKGLLLSSICLARDKDEEWSFSKNTGAVNLFPDLWEERLKFLEKFNATPSTAAAILLKQMESGNQNIINEIAAGVMNWEGNLMTSQSNLTITDPDDVTEDNIASVKIFLSYEANDFYLAPNQLINNIGKIKNIPTIIVHGRYDLLCPLDNAWELQKKLSNVETIILPSSNHRLTADGEIAKNLAFTNFLNIQKE